MFEKYSGLFGLDYFASGAVCPTGFATKSVMYKVELSISGQDGYTIYLVYNILAQFDWSIHHHSAESVAEGVVFAHQILTQLEAVR